MVTFVARDALSDLYVHVIFILLAHTWIIAKSSFHFNLSFSWMLLMLVVTYGLLLLWRMHFILPSSLLLDWKRNESRRHIPGSLSRREQWLRSGRRSSVTRCKQSLLCQCLSICLKQIPNHWVEPSRWRQVERKHSWINTGQARYSHSWVRRCSWSLPSRQDGLALQSVQGSEYQLLIIIRSQDKNKKEFLIFTVQSRPA